MYKEGQNMDNINQDFSQLMSQKDFHKSDKYFDLLMTILHIYNLRFEEIKSELPKRKFLARKKSSDFEMIQRDVSTDLQLETKITSGKLEFMSKIFSQTSENTNFPISTTQNLLNSMSSGDNFDSYYLETELKGFLGSRFSSELMTAMTHLLSQKYNYDYANNLPFDDTWKDRKLRISDRIMHLSRTFDIIEGSNSQKCKELSALDSGFDKMCNADAQISDYETRKSKYFEAENFILNELSRIEFYLDNFIQNMSIKEVILDRIDEIRQSKYFRNFHPSDSEKRKLEIMRDFLDEISKYYPKFVDEKEISEARKAIDQLEFDILYREDVRLLMNTGQAPGKCLFTQTPSKGDLTMLYKLILEDIRSNPLDYIAFLHNNFFNIHLTNVDFSEYNKSSEQNTDNNYSNTDINYFYLRQFMKIILPYKSIIDCQNFYKKFGFDCKFLCMGFRQKLIKIIYDLTKDTPEFKELEAKIQEGTEPPKEFKSIGALKNEVVRKIYSHKDCIVAIPIEDNFFTLDVYENYNKDFFDLSVDSIFNQCLLDIDARDDYIFRRFENARRQTHYYYSDIYLKNFFYDLKHLYNKYPNYILYALATSLSDYCNPYHEILEKILDEVYTMTSSEELKKLPTLSSYFLPIEYDAKYFNDCRDDAISIDMLYINRNKIKSNLPISLIKKDGQICLVFNTKDFADLPLDYGKCKSYELTQEEIENIQKNNDIQLFPGQGQKVQRKDAQEDPGADSHEL